MIKKRSKKGAFFLKYFFIFSAIFLISSVLVGISLMAFVANFVSVDVLDKTRLYADQLAKATTEILVSGTIHDNPEAAVLLMCEDVKFLSKTTGDDVFVCDKDGRVIICPHTASGYDIKNDTPCEAHSKIVLSSTYVQKAKSSHVSEFTTLGATYEDLHSVAIEPFYVDNNCIGFCVVASPLSGNVFGYLKNILIMFLVSSAIVLVLVTIAVYFMTGRIAKPIRNLETATTLYSSGDFSYRVPEINTNDELALLITKFNSMATSLSQLENSRRSFVANVSHEFKTPMTTIGGFINGILDGTIPPEKHSYYLNIVSSEISRLSKMVTMMLNISKIETGNIDMNIEKFDVSQKLISTFLGFEQLINKKNISIEGFDDLESIYINADSAMIDQVIYNLADNAVKFTNQDGKIIVNTASDNDKVILAITNTGKGIPEKDLEKVFDRFYKVDQSRSTDVKSTGLGLYLIKSIVSLHNGSITVESEENKFTRFTVKLPKSIN